MDAQRFGKHLAVGLLLLLMAKVVLSAPDPVPPQNVTLGSGGRFIGASSGFAMSATSGNITAISIAHVQSSQYWQGYYGNISGEITLDDGSNNTLFSWALANPSGEIYASNQSNGIKWGNVTCVNLTNATSSDTHGSSKINRTTIQSAYNLTDQNAENISSTFNSTFSGTLNVATRTITSSDQCPQLTTYKNEAWQTVSFKEVLLFDNLSALLFTSIIQENVDGFRSGTDPHDFQMMVLEDGSAGGPDSTSTTYYFYVELN